MLAGDLLRGAGGVEVRQDDDGDAVVGIDLVARGEAGDFAAVRDHAAAVDDADADAEAVARCRRRWSARTSVSSARYDAGFRIV